MDELESGAGEEAAESAAQLVTWRRIWARARHNAFTDLARFRERWYCAFREGRSHAGCAGRVRVLVSGDGERWRSAARLAVRHVDLRDPKLSIRPDGALMLLAGGTDLPRRGGTPGSAGRRPRVFLSPDGTRWSAPHPILADGEWLWRVTWHEGRAWGCSYHLGEGEEWAVTLLVSGDGLAWESVRGLEVPGRPNETTLRFLPDGRMMALVRREGGDRRGRWGQPAAFHRLGLAAGAASLRRAELPRAAGRQPVGGRAGLPRGRLPHRAGPAHPPHLRAGAGSAGRGGLQLPGVGLARGTAVGQLVCLAGERDGGPAGPGAPGRVRFKTGPAFFITFTLRQSGSGGSRRGKDQPG